MTEIRVTSETGGQKGDKAAKLGAIAPLALLKLAEVAGFGAEKYDAFNYLKGYDWSLSFNAAQRHALAFWNGEDNDPESGLPHPLHFAWHGLCLASFLMRGLGTDDRFKQEVEVEDLDVPDWLQEAMNEMGTVINIFVQSEAKDDLINDLNDYHNRH